MKTHERIRGLREDRDINQEQFGKALHMSQRKISYIERGERAITTEELAAICLFFDVSADYILNLPTTLRDPRKRK